MSKKSSATVADPILEKMKIAAKALFELPPFEDQAEWEAELLRKLESESEKTIDGKDGDE